MEPKPTRFAMKTLHIWAALLASLLLATGCKKDEDMPTCPGEYTLEVYRDRAALVVRTGPDTYCLTVDSTDLATNLYSEANVLVPARRLPAEFRVGGLRVLFSGRKQSCYGLTTSPDLRTAFGYKLELNSVKRE